MGADLYRKSISDAARDRWNPIFTEAARKRDVRIHELESKGKSDKQSWNDKQVKLLQKEVEDAYEKMHPDEGYFRDSYNITSVLNRMGLSWWNDIAKLQGKSGKISVKNLKKMVEMIEAAPIKPLTLEEYKNNCSQAQPIETWQPYFEKRKAALLKFLKGAIEAKESIYASL